MIASLDDVQGRGCIHPLSNTVEKVERTEGVARSLRKQDWRGRVQQHLVAKPRPVARAA